jgi:hypothetical protein
MNHPEMNDAMLWLSANGTWKLAEYDHEDEYMYAKEARNLNGGN